MKIIGLVGSKGSGKTFLGVKLAKELSKRGHQVGAIKHTRQGLDFLPRDTARYQKYCQEVIGASGVETVKFSRPPQNLESILGSMESDIVIVEGFTPLDSKHLTGFKENKTFPKIVCLKAEQKFQSTGLEIATVRKGQVDEAKLKSLCDLIEKKAFKLPRLNCGKCAAGSCAGLAREIVKGEKSPDDCRSQPTDVTVSMGGQQIPLNPFISKIFKETVKGFLSSLKDAKEGNIEIMITTEARKK